jgi:hypothetical protein
MVPLLLHSPELQRRHLEPRQDLTSTERAFYSAATRAPGEAQVALEGFYSFCSADELVVPWGSSSYPAAVAQGVPNLAGVPVFAVHRLALWPSMCRTR